MMVSTPAVAMVVERYLFQSWVKHSEGGKVWVGRELIVGGGPWMGIRCTRWFDAEAGVRRSKMRRWESDDTEERMEGECGEKAEE
jgi:hypothetical protein